MPVAELTAEQIRQLVGTHHAAAGFEYPPAGMQPYYHWLVRTLHLLGESSAGALRVAASDADAVSVQVAPGRASLNGAALSFAGQTLALGEFNNSTALLWLYDEGGGAGALGRGGAGEGWPATPHLKLAEVTLDAGAIVAIVDRRFEAMLSLRQTAADGNTAPLADDSGGSPGGSSVPEITDLASAADAVATLAAYGNVLRGELNDLRAKLRAAGLMAG